MIWNTENMIEEFISIGMKAYKKNSKGSIEARKLDRHESVIIQGQEFTCWREYTVFKMAEYICKVIPKSRVEVMLDGNNSSIKIELNEFEQEKLNRQMFLFLEKIK